MKEHGVLYTSEEPKRLLASQPSSFCVRNGINQDGPLVLPLSHMSGESAQLQETHFGHSARRDTCMPRTTRTKVNKLSSLSCRGLLNSATQ
jgi:hypothetical protein